MTVERAFLFRQAGAVVVAELGEPHVAGLLHPGEPFGDRHVADGVQGAVRGVVLIQGAGDAERERAGHQRGAFFRCGFGRHSHDRRAWQRFMLRQEPQTVRAGLAPGVRRR